MLLPLVKGPEEVLLPLEAEEVELVEMVLFPLTEEMMQVLFQFEVEQEEEEVEMLLSLKVEVMV